MDKKKYKFNVYINGGSYGKYGPKEIVGTTLTLWWEANDPEGAINRIHEWMERSNKLRTGRFQDEWTGFKMLEETA